MTCLDLPSSRVFVFFFSYFLYNCAVPMRIPGECKSSTSSVYMHILYTFTYVDDMLMHPACLLLLCGRDSLFCGREGA